MLKNTIILSCVALLLSACVLLLYYEPVSFSVSGDAAIMTGVIDGNIGEKLQTLFDEHPEKQPRTPEIPSLLQSNGHPRRILLVHAARRAQRRDALDVCRGAAALSGGYALIG